MTTPGRELIPFTTPVAPEWIDYNGHLNEGYFVVAFALSTDAALDRLGIGARYHQDTERSLFTVESHIRYMDQVRDGDLLDVRSTVIGVDSKRLRLWHEMFVDGTLRATQEAMLLHVDANTGRTTPFSDVTISLIDEFVADAPAEAGIGIKPTQPR